MALPAPVHRPTNWYAVDQDWLDNFKPPREPYELLMLAVLVDAVERMTVTSRKRSKAKSRGCYAPDDSDYKWMFERGWYRDEFLSFEFICEHFGLPADRIRRVVKNWKRRVDLRRRIA